MVSMLLFCMLISMVSADTWDNYSVDGMDVISITGGDKGAAYDKVVIMLHGGGGSSQDWAYLYKDGHIKDLKGKKYVFPNAPFEVSSAKGKGYLWYYDYKRPDCGLDDDCAYNLTSIHYSGSKLASLIEHERGLVGGNGKKVYLAGFSQGGQTTAYMQIAKLDFALGGVIIFDGYPLPPLPDMKGAQPAAAKKNATYYGDDMRWMLYWGGLDPIFPSNFSLNGYHEIFHALEVDDVIKIEHVNPSMGHSLDFYEFELMRTFIDGKDYEDSISKKKNEIY